MLLYNVPKDYNIYYNSIQYAHIYYNTYNIHENIAYTQCSYIPKVIYT